MQYQPPAPRDQIARSAGIAIAVIIAAGCGIYLLHNRGDIGQPLSCAQQYANWKSGPTSAAAEKAQADASSLSAAGSIDDITGMVSAIEAVGADAVALQGYPMPACADPAGYWPQVLAELKAAGGNAGTSSGLGALVLAAAPLRLLPATQAKLDAELAATAGVKAPVTVPSAAAVTPAPLPTQATTAPAAAPSASVTPQPTTATVAPATTPAPTLASAPTAGGA